MLDSRDVRLVASSKQSIKRHRTFFSSILDCVSAVRRGAEVGRVLLHPGAALAALQWAPAPGFAPGGADGKGAAASRGGASSDSLSAADALAAKQLLRATLLGVGETVHAAPAAVAPHAPLHTSLAFWALQPGRCGRCASLVLSIALLRWHSAGLSLPAAVTELHCRAAVSLPASDSAACI